MTSWTKAGFNNTDLFLFENFRGLVLNDTGLESEVCKVCTSHLSSHISTSGYRKSFRTNLFADIWGEAERMLAESDKWIFIGYSLPTSDYEFKHLLKLCEVKLSHMKKNRLSMDVVLLEDDAGALRYRKFFGDRVKFVCNKGIENYLEKCLST